MSTKLWYKTPAIEPSKLDKQTSLLPIGNGYMAALISGQTRLERLQFNEESLWTGGPGGRRRDSNKGDGGEYNFGYQKDAESPPSTDEIFAAMKSGSFTNDMMHAMLGTSDGYGAYQNFGWLNFEYLHAEVQNYRRELDLETAVACITYESGGVLYKRQYFASYPDRVIVVKISADKPEVNLIISAESAHENVIARYMVCDTDPPTKACLASFSHPLKKGDCDTILAERINWCRNRSACIHLSGNLPDNKMLYAAHFNITIAKGSIRTCGSKISISGADCVTIVFSAATNYKNEFLGLEHSTYRHDKDPSDLAAEYVKRAADKGYTALWAAHMADYKSLFGRVRLNIGGGVNLPTDELIQDYGLSPKADRTLEELLFQYGRYLLIASSRLGTLPANLQGKWNLENEPPWSSDYHYNINLQMNYWPSGNTNLAECALPLADFVESLVPTGELTAQKYNGVDKGWTLHTSGNIFGLTAPGWGLIWGWSPANNAFICQNLWDYYMYSGDRETLECKIYPIIKGAALFWISALKQDSDSLVAVPSLSPEHGPVTYATAYDQQLIWELFDFTIRAIDELGIVEDYSLRLELVEKMRLLNPAEIGAFGQIMEWKGQLTDYDGIYDDEHRHISQLAGLYPGTLINRQTPQLIEAAKVTLNRRGDGATGWSMGWKINFWARVFDGNRAHALIQNLIRDNIAQNLFGLHELPAPRYSAFQIDANMGYTAGVAEMLIQSSTDYIDILPALPDAWPAGKAVGLKARGSHTVDIAWDINDLTIKVKPGLLCRGTVTLRCSRFLGKNVVLKVDGVVHSVIQAEDAVTFSAKAGVEYNLNPQFLPKCCKHL